MGLFLAPAFLTWALFAAMVGLDNGTYAFLGALMYVAMIFTLGEVTIRRRQRKEARAEVFYED